MTDKERYYKNRADFYERKNNEINEHENSVFIKVCVYFFILIALLGTYVLVNTNVDLTSTGTISGDRELLNNTYVQVWTSFSQWVNDTYTSINDFFVNAKTTIINAYSGVSSFFTSAINWFVDLFNGRLF